MGDPKNPYRPYTYQAAEHDRVYETHRAAQRQADRDFVEAMTQPPPNYGATTGGSWSGPRTRSVGGQDAGTFWISAALIIGFLWLGDRIGNYWTAGAAIVALLLAVSAVIAIVRAFFRTTLGQMVATVLSVVTVGVAIVAAVWGIHEMFGAAGLYWAGVLVAGYLTLRLALYLLAAFFRTAVGKATLWIGIATGAAYLFLS